ncbi:MULTISPECIES: hypothetical protein [unclassified Roseovarius]|uniref:hypothetical protein n=1 Tax=unclassified Roseovarius TaxID=2614913 RepID=UPI00273DEECB|nr:MULTISPECIES: hypothetical protein [unclassified Roseovarius]
MDAEKNFVRALNDYQSRTKNVSDLVKYLGFGLLAAFYAIRTEINALEPEDLLRHVHLGIGMSGALIIIFDYLQNIFAARSSMVALKDKSNFHQYHKTSFNYRFGLGCYYIKQGATAVGSILLVYLILFL